MSGREQASLRNALVIGFGTNPDLAPIGRDIVSDDDTFQRVFNWWNTPGMRTVSDLVVSTYITQELVNPVLGAPGGRQPQTLNFRNSVPFYVTRMVVQAQAPDGSALNGRLFRVGWQTNDNWTVCPPTPANMYWSPGLDNIPLAVPLRIVPQQTLVASVFVDDSIATNGVGRLQAAVTCIRLAV